MPLSEHEKRVLDQIERALYAEDPKFAQTVRARDPRVHYRRRITQAAIGFVAGVGLLLAGVIIKIIPLGVAGFVVMLACCMWALSSWRRMNGATTDRIPRARRPRRSMRAMHARFMERVEERWRRRQENGGL